MTDNAELIAKLYERIATHGEGWEPIDERLMSEAADRLAAANARADEWKAAAEAEYQQHSDTKMAAEARLAEAERRLHDYQARVIPAETGIVAAEARIAKLTDIDGAVYVAAITWCGEKDRETFQSDIDYFKNMWSSLPGLEAYVDRELGRRVRAALQSEEKPK